MNFINILLRDKSSLKLLVPFKVRMAEIMKTKTGCEEEMKEAIETSNSVIEKVYRRTPKNSKKPEAL